MKRLKQFFKKLVPMNQAETGPRVFLEEMLENHASFKSVMVVIQYHDNTMDCDWSKIETPDLAQACVVLQMQMQNCIRDRCKR